jgi:hypothetical protein
MDGQEMDYVKQRVNTVGNKDGETELPYTTIIINNFEILVMMDTGATLKIIDEVTYSRMRDKPKLKKTRVRLFSYKCSISISLIGEFKAMVTCIKRSVEAAFVVLKGWAKCLIAYKTLKELGVIQKVNNFESDNVPAITVDQLMRHFPSVFTKKLGEFKKYEISLQIDEKVKSTFMKLRRIPYAMRDSMTECINELIEATSWLLPALAVKKKDGSLRLVVVGSHTKLAFKRTRYLIPTIEEITAEIDTAFVFSKIDVRKAFHQLVLAESSRYITTLSIDEMND